MLLLKDIYSFLPFRCFLNVWFICFLFIINSPNKIYFFPLTPWLLLSSISVSRMPLNIFHNPGLVVMNFFSLYLSLSNFIYFLICEDNFAGYNIWVDNIFIMGLRYIIQILPTFKVFVELSTDIPIVLTLSVIWQFSLKAFNILYLKFFILKTN